MKTKKQALDFCLAQKDVYLDYPFDDNWATVRHRSNRKVFAFIYQYGQEIRMNLKVRPLDGDFLRRQYPAIVPAYHMNKQHWVTVILDDSLPDSVLFPLIFSSYELTQK